MDSHCSNTDSSSYIFVVSHPAGMNDLHDALRSRSSVDPTVDEIQTIVEHLQRENDELKKMVQKEHETIKKQYDILLQSTEQVERVMKQQLERREQDKIVIEQLLSENAVLQSRLTKRCHHCDDFDERLQHPLQDLDRVKCHLNSKNDERENQTIGTQHLQVELSALPNDINQLKLVNSRLLAEKRDLVAINVELQAKCTALASNIEEVCEVGGDNQVFVIVDPNVAKPRENQIAKNEENTIKNLLQQLNLEQLKSQVLEMKLKEESAKSEQLTRDLQEQKVLRRLAPTSQEYYMMKNIKLCDELINSKTTLVEVQSGLLMWQDRCVTLENQLHVKYPNPIEVSATAPQKQVELLQEERQTNECWKSNLKDTEAKHRELIHDEHSQLQNKWEVFSQSQGDKSQKDESYYKLEIKDLQQKLDALTTEFEETKNSLAVKETDLLRTKTELEKLRLECETIPILKTQIEIYEGDFREEREDRENREMHLTYVLQELLRPTSMINELNRSITERSTTSSTSQVVRMMTRSIFNTFGMS